MKINLLIALGFLCLLASSLSFAGCVRTSCVTTTYSQRTVCATPGMDCACTDPDCNNRYNCMSRSKCCEAFGNVGAR